MTDRPILYSGPMVRALLARRKTQTRRVMRTNHVGYRSFLRWDGRPHTRAMMACSNGDPGRPESSVFCEDNRIGVPGDRLWVRETWRYHDWTEDGDPWIQYAADDACRLCEHVTADWADRVRDVWATLSDPDNYQIDGAARDRKWRPSIFLPRWASRLTLRVTSVRVERLQAITEADAIAEGCSPRDAAFVAQVGGGRRRDMENTARGAYACLWDDLNGKRAPWASNPWVWVVGFEVEPTTKPNEDRGPTRPHGETP